MARHLMARSKSSQRNKLKYTSQAAALYSLNAMTNYSHAEPSADDGRLGQGAEAKRPRHNLFDPQEIVPSPGISSESRMDLICIGGSND